MGTNGHGNNENCGAGPLVSVIVPTRDRPHFLREAVRSILDQTFRNFEIIVINDGGEDVSGLLDEFRDGRITHINNRVSRGPSAARNAGLKAAKGKYIAYLDDDDIYYPDHLERLVAYLEKNNREVAYSNSYQAYQKWDGSGFVTGRKKPCGQDFDSQGLLVKDYIPILTVMHRRDCLTETGLFDEGLKVHEDWDLFIRMSRRFDFHHINVATAEFRAREGADSITSGDLPNFLKVMKQIHSRYSGCISDPKTVLAQKAIISMNEAKMEQKNYVRMYEIKSGADDDGLDAKVSVVLPVMDTAEGLERLAEKIISQRKIKDIELVIITGPDVASIQAPGGSGVKIVRSACGADNYGGLLNQALSECTGDYIVFTDQDTVPASNYWLFGMVRPFRSYPELAVTSCRRLHKPGDDLFTLWMNASNDESPYFGSDSICFISGDPESPRWRLFDKELKKRLAFFDGGSACARREVFDEMNFSERKDAGEVFMDFGIRLLGRRKPVGYLKSSGVYLLREESPAYLLKRSYREAKMLHNFMNGMPYFFHINNLGPEDVKSNIVMLYELIKKSVTDMKDGDNPVMSARSFLSNLTANMNGSCPSVYKAPGPETELDGLLRQVAGKCDVNKRGADNPGNNFLLPDFMNRFERFSNFLCTALNLEGRQEEFIPGIYKIFADMAGEVLGACCLEADEMDHAPEDIENWKRVLV